MAITGEEFLQKLEQARQGSAAIGQTAANIAGAAGQVVGAYQAGKTSAAAGNGSIGVEVDAGGGIKFLGVALIAALLIVVLKVKK
jgi:hypothetical protein